MIEIKNLRKSFDGTVDVLKDLTSSIPDNVIYGLVGANGSGKSTLLRCINSIYKADAGEILIDGEFSYDNEEIKKEMVFVPDDLFFYPGYSLYDTAKFYQSMYEKFDIEFVFDTARKLKLDIEKSVNTLSKGMRRQCAIICALATNAKYIFFDETFDGIDPVVRQYFKKLIARQMTKQDTTIIMTSHNLRELEDICDNLGLINDKKIIFESDIDTLKTDMLKVQISLKGEMDEDTFKDLDVLYYKKVGRVATLIVKDAKKSKKYLESLKPIILDYLPLTLEEIFIYQMEVMGYAFAEMD